MSFWGSTVPEWLHNHRQIFCTLTCLSESSTLSSRLLNFTCHGQINYSIKLTRVLDSLSRPVEINYLKCTLFVDKVILVRQIVMSRRITVAVLYPVHRTQINTLFICTLLTKHAVGVLIYDVYRKCFSLVSWMLHFSFCILPPEIWPPNWSFLKSTNDDLGY